VAAGTPPWVTYVFMAACGLVYVGQISAATVTINLAYFPGAMEAQPWRYLTYALAHNPSGLPLHIGLNMYCMYLLGPPLEFHFGVRRYLALIVLTALGGSVGYQLLAIQPSWMLGASGVVFGLFGALVTAGPRLGLRIGGIVAIIVLNFVLGIFVPAIAWQGHLGGLAVGAACGAILVYAPRRHRTIVQAVGLLGLGALLALAAAVA
jgi:membrane associated rhomboid family serine protease